jgi:hypothetical protein
MSNFQATTLCYIPEGNILQGPTTRSAVYVCVFWFLNAMWIQEVCWKNLSNIVS